MPHSHAHNSHQSMHSRHHRTHHQDDEHNFHDEPLGGEGHLSRSHHSTSEHGEVLRTASSGGNSVHSNRLSPTHGNSKSLLDSSHTDEDDTPPTTPKGADGDKDILDDDHYLTGTLPEGSFSFLVSAPVISSPFLSGLFVFAFKTTIYGLIASNLIGPDPTNRLGFPASVTAPVIVSQFFALLIAVATQDDVVQGLNLLYQGYRRDGLGTAFSGASLLKWILGVFSHLADGVFGLAVTFLLIVTSSNVVELLLNFTAIEFVSLLDNGAFVLASLGFMGKANKIMAERVVETEYLIARKKVASPTMQMWMLILSYICLVAGWGVIYHRQITGVYTPGTLIVQFDDELDIRLGSFSGRYFLVNRRGKFGFDRIRYHSEFGTGTFGYCNSERVWTFSELRDTDPCGEFTAKSSFSTDFDITTTATDTWFVTNNPSQKRYLPMVGFKIAINCFLDEHCGGIGHGTCSGNLCTCNEPYYGWRCDYDKTETCDKLETDELLAGPFVGTQPYENRFTILQDEQQENVLVYDHPVYMSVVDDDGNGDIMMFTGIRWGMFPIPLELKGQINVTDRLAMANYLSSDLDVYMFLNSREFFVSDFVIFDSPSDVATPIGLSWTLGRRNENLEATFRSSDAVLLCAVCGAANPCANNNTCGASGACDCTNGATGTLCRVTPNGDGFCDRGFFNSDGFAYDGGDCCESTCVNFGNNTCGLAFLGEFEPPVDLEFSNCLEPSELCTPKSLDQRCWAPKSQITTAVASTQGYMMKLSGNGRVLVEAAPLSERVRIADQLDSQWTTRGAVLEDVRGSLFGAAVAVYTPPGIVARQNLVGVDTIVAVGLYRLDQGAIKVYAWDVVDEKCRTIAPELPLCRESCRITGLELGSMMETVTMAVGLESRDVVVYKARRDGSSALWKLVDSVSGSSFALSGDGKTLAVVPDTSSPTVEVYRIDLTNNVQPVQLLASGDIGFGISDTTILTMRLSHDGAFLSAVTLGAGVDKLLRLRLETDLPPTIDTGKIAGPVSRKTIGAGFIPAFFSADGTSVVFTVDESGLTLQTYAFHETLQQWMRVGEDYSDVELDSSFAVSSDGSSIVVGRQGRLNALKLSPLCLPGDDSYRASLVLGPTPRNVSWSLQSYRVIGNTTVFTGLVNEVCDGCYDDTMLYGETSIVRRGCIPNDQCLLLKFNDTSGRRESFVRMFRDESVKVNKVAGFFEEVYSVDPPSGCQTDEPLCSSEALSLFSLTLTRDHFLQQPNWYLEDDMGNVLDRGFELNFTADDGPPATLIHQRCYPSTIQCFRFTIDYTGDECCRFGTGQYRLNWQGYELNRTNAELFKYGERLSFGNCSSSSVVAADAVAVTIKFDDNPDDARWYIQDAGGSTVDSWNASNLGLQTRVRTTTAFFLEDLSGCLSFFIEDEGEDGFSGTNAGGYTLLFNDRLIASRDGLFGYSERTTFGQGQFCPINTVQSEFIYGLGATGQTTKPSKVVYRR